MTSVTCAMNRNELQFKREELLLGISGSVLQIWKDEAQLKRNDPERFGVLIGSRTEGTEEHWIEEVTKQFSGDRATRHSFLMQDKRHQRVVDQAFQHSKGMLGYVGTWHTHPEPIPKPSAVDLKDWRACVKRNPGRQLFFVIVGMEQICVYIFHRWRFVPLKRVNND